jgi:hypothetical protein
VAEVVAAEVVVAAAGVVVAVAVGRGSSQPSLR